jgi:hypothetical protein
LFHANFIICGQQSEEVFCILLITQTLRNESEARKAGEQ